MREFKGYQIRQTYEQFEKLLQEAGIKADGLDVRSLAADHLIILDGNILGRYRYLSGKFEAENGYVYDWKKELLTHPDGSTESVTFAAALQVIILYK